MSASKDRIEFVLPSRYYYYAKGFSHSSSTLANGMSDSNCAKVLEKSFGLGRYRSHQLFKQNPDHFRIICRPSQFARFIVYRNEFGDCVNGIKDLNPKIIAKPNMFSDLERATGVPARDVELVLQAYMDHKAQKVFGNIEEIERSYPNTCIDVSDNFDK